MLTARKNVALNALIYRLLIKLPLQNGFHTVHYRQAGPVPASDAPCLLIGNHSAWWDAHLPMAANETRWHLDGYVMVEDTQLARYQFFRAIGAFSVNRRDGRSALESLNCAAKLLSEAPRRLVLIFPQGEILANDHRPLTFFNGSGHIVKKVVAQRGVCAVYPMALRYEFLGEQKPDAFISVGPALHFDATNATNATNATDARAVTAQMQAALTRELDQLRDDVVAYRFDGFVPLVKGRGSINRLWDAVRGRRPIGRVGDV